MSSNTTGEGGISSYFKWLINYEPPLNNPDTDARSFVAQFDSSFDINHPTFQACSYQSAVAEAHRQSKLLLVYIHAPLHQDTDRFCRTVLCSPTFTEYVDRNFLFWGGSSYAVEAYSLCAQLNVTTFPFLAVFQCQGQRSVKVVDRISGFCEESEIVEKFRAMVTIQAAVTERNRAAELRRQEEIELRQQQDAEYREAEELDRLAREKEEEDRVRAEEAEQQQQLESALELSRQLDREACMRRLKESLPPEPATDRKDVAVVRFQLPSSSSGGNAKISRRFCKDDTVQVLYDYLSVHFFEQDMKVKNFVMSTNFPKKDLTEKGETLAAVGLFPRGALFVTDLDA